jgi:hypothetical protein
MHRSAITTVAFVLAVAASFTPLRAQKPYPIFLGNSITYSRSGVDTAMMRISDMMGDSIIADREVIGSSTILNIWNSRNVLAKVQANGYSHVVLQPYVGDLSSVRSFATECDTIFPRIQAAGARVVLYFSWPFAAAVDSWDSTAVLAVYDSLAAEHDLDVVPVGPSFIWWYANTGIRMYDDHVHPSPMAQYLAGTFFYTYLMQKPVVGEAVRAVYELGSLQAQKMHDQAAATLLSSAVANPPGLLVGSPRGSTGGFFGAFDVQGRLRRFSAAPGLVLTPEGTALGVGNGYRATPGWSWQ